jgi:hypothetical protein
MNKLSSSYSNPPRWLEYLLLRLLRARDREAVSGDLLEEYREVIVPERGSARANLWYFKQVIGFINNFKFGLALGAVLAGFNLVATLVSPLAEDTPLRVGTFLAVVMLFWGWSGFAAEKRTAQIFQAAKAGAIVGAISIGLFHFAAILRLNLFLDIVARRSDWQGLILKFNQSGFESLRAYANYTYLQSAGLVLLAGTLVGAICGTVGGLVARVVKSDRTRLLERP